LTATAVVAGLAGLSLVTLPAMAGAATSPHAAAANTSGYIRACVNSSYAGTTNVAINGPGVSLTVPVTTSSSTHHACAPQKRVPTGSYQVTQSAESNYTTTGIVVRPTFEASNMSVSSRTATVGVAKSAQTRVTFANTPNSNPTPPPPGTGYIEVCKFAADNFVTGTVNISINDGTSTINQTLPVGECTGPTLVDAGHVTVTETAPAPYYLSRVTTNPTNALVSVSGSTVVVNVVQSPDSSNETRVNLYNATNMGNFKICKIVTSNSGALTSSPNNSFVFDPSYQLAGSNTWTTLPKVTVQVISTGTAYCVLDQYALPLGTLVKVTEEGTNNVQLLGVSVQPASQDAGSTSSQAMFKIGPNPGGVVTATFTNEAFGTIEICKLIDDSTWNPSWRAGTGNPNSSYNGTPFQFSINGAPSITVLAGECSGPIAVPAGTATVQETVAPNFNFEKFIAVGPDQSSRIASGSSSTSNPITVNVPFGGVGNETLVTALNTVQTGQIKVCKINNGPSVGAYAFNFTTTWTSNGTNYTKTDSLRPMQAGTAGEVCSSLSNPIPVIQPGGQATTFTTTEGKSPYVHDANGNPTVEPTSIVYGGNGMVIEIRAWQQGDGNTEDGMYHGTATVGQGVNVFTFTNSLVLDP
jgi:predicted cupin superfamily sugar epimerase